MASRTTRINANNNNIMTMIIIIINFENRLRCVVEERGLRAVFKDKQSSYQQLLVKAKLPSLYNRRLQDICILMYKVKHNLCPRTICDMFLTNSHTYDLRQKDFDQPSFNPVTHGKLNSIPKSKTLEQKYQARTDQLPVLSSLRPGYAVLI